MDDMRRAVLSASDIVAEAEKFAEEAVVFEAGCSGMVRAAYRAGGISIPDAYTANEMLKQYPAVDPDSVQPGDVAGWTAEPNGHVVIYVRPDRYVNCPGPRQATKINRNMGRALEFRRPSVGQ